MHQMNRRSFLRLSGGAFAGFVSLQYGGCGRTREVAIAAIGEGGYGPLVPAGPQLALPEGFRYRAIGLEGSMMSDAAATPPAHDGMCAFPLPNGNIRLIRNHEVFDQFDERSLPGGGRYTYDPKAGGGATSLEVHPASRELLRDFQSLDGTHVNCAGGPTPWASWLSCEETVDGPADGWGRQHGYVFEVPASAEGLVAPTPLKEMGRFVHEAVAVDPSTNVVYETEDQDRAGLYRFIPNQPGPAGSAARLAEGGRLQMLAVRGTRNCDFATGQSVGVVREVEWVEIDDPDPRDPSASAVFEQGWARGGARFRRLEGCWFSEGSIYFNCTTGGDAGTGQVWRYTPAPDGSGKLRLLFESPGTGVLDHPDNLCVSPRGGIVLCEDGVEDHLFVRGLTPRGKIFDFAQNIANGSELAGATFSPDGQTLFVNSQRDPATTFAIWGPWERGAL